VASPAAHDASPDPQPLWPSPSGPEFSGGNEVRLLRGGDELFPAQVQAILAARIEVWLATYIFHNDLAGEQLVRALCAAAQRGVRVRVVVDGFGSKQSLAWLSEQLHDSGVALAVFRPIDRWWRWLQPGQLRRLHQKLCVVDGEQAFVGGINIIDDRNDLNHGLCEQARLDFAVGLRGLVVQPVEQACRAVWTRAWLGRDFSEELVALFKSPAPMRRAKRLLRRLRMPGQRGPQSLDAWLPPVRAAFVLRDNLRRRRTIEHAYVRAIRSARHRVDLVTPYFYPGLAFRKALRDTARRGVQVRLLLQGKVDYRIAGMAASVLYEELLRDGVRVFEYLPAFLHAKVAVVDADWATVGSSNIDPLSLLLNLEANVIVQDPAFASELSSEFERAIAVSREVDRKTRLLPGWRGVLRRGLVAWCAYVYLRVAGATGRY
jgi:cardiolipin synthase